MADEILQIIGREEARALGLKRYFTGEPCAHGHICQRQVKSSTCVMCSRAATRKWRIRNPEKIARYRIIDRENHKAAVARWYREHRDEVNARAVDWRKRNPEKARISNLKSVKSENHKRATRNWRKNNPAMVRVHDANKRAKRKKAEGKHTLKDVLRIVERQNWKCANCAASVKNGYHVDHVMPLSRGGSNWPSNLQILCPPCNSRKNAKLPEEWAKENGKLL